MTQETFLEQLPQAAFEVCNGMITAVNNAASAQLPELTPGNQIPDFLFDALSEDSRSGQFHHNNQVYIFTRLNTPKHSIVMFLPENQLSLTLPQIEGFSRQMRGQMAAFLNQVELLARHSSDPEQINDDLKKLNHTFHQMLRLVNHLEFLSIPTEDAELNFCPITMDLAGLCADTCRQAAPLLRQSNVGLSYSSSHAGLLISGDPSLLQRALLSVLSNAAKFSSGGKVSLTLHQNHHKAILTITDGNPNPVDVLSMLSQPSNAIPQPHQGAGLGLSVAQRIIHLHHGTLLYHNDPSGGLVFVIALPFGTPSTTFSLQTPLMEEDAGLSPLLVELADVLPESVFELDPMN